MPPKLNNKRKHEIAGNEGTMMEKFFRDIEEKNKKRREDEQKKAQILGQSLGLALACTDAESKENTHWLALARKYGTKSHDYKLTPEEFNEFMIVHGGSDVPMFAPSAEPGLRVMLNNALLLFVKAGAEYSTCNNQEAARMPHARTVLPAFAHLVHSDWFKKGFTTDETALSLGALTINYTIYKCSLKKITDVLILKNVI